MEDQSNTDQPLNALRILRQQAKIVEKGNHGRPSINQR